MQNLRMLSTRRGSPDGIQVHWYFEGNSYELTDSLAAIFLKEGWAEPDVPKDEPSDDLPEAGDPKANVAAAPKQEYARKKR